MSCVWYWFYVNLGVPRGFWLVTKSAVVIVVVFIDYWHTLKDNSSITETSRTRTAVQSKAGSDSQADINPPVEDQDTKYEPPTLTPTPSSLSSVSSNQLRMLITMMWSMEPKIIQYHRHSQIGLGWWNQRLFNQKCS